MTHWATLRIVSTRMAPSRCTCSSTCRWQAQWKSDSKPSNYNERCLFVFIRLTSHLESLWKCTIACEAYWMSSSGECRKQSQAHSEEARNEHCTGWWIAEVPGNCRVKQQQFIRGHVVGTLWTVRGMHAMFSIFFKRDLIQGKTTYACTCWRYSQSWRMHMDVWSAGKVRLRTRSCCTYD